jgi:hypothetical protein
MDILFFPLMAMGMVLIMAPYIALIPAIIFFGCYKKSKRKSNLIAVVLWGIYSVYESGMMLRILCTGECNIRVDLLVIYPVLIIVSIYAAVSFFWWRKIAKS